MADTTRLTPSVCLLVGIVRLESELLAELHTWKLEKCNRLYQDNAKGDGPEVLTGLSADLSQPKYLTNELLLPLHHHHPGQTLSFPGGLPALTTRGRRTLPQKHNAARGAGDGG